MPQVQGFFTQPFAEPPSLVETETNLPEPAQPTSHPPNTGPLLSRTSIFTGAIILCMIIAVPGGLAASVHLVSVTSVTLNIAYSGNASIQWFDFSPRDVSGPLFALGNGKMQFRFSLSNLGLFESHTINSLSMVTPGFVLYSPGLPVSIPDLATVTLSVQLQAPDQNYYGPVTIQIQTS